MVKASTPNVLTATFLTALIVDEIGLVAMTLRLNAADRLGTVLGRILRAECEI